MADRKRRIHTYVPRDVTSRLWAYSYYLETDIEIRATENGRLDGTARAVDAVDRNLR